MNINPLDERLSAFGARVITVDGHDVEALAAAGAYRNDGRPLVVLAYTDPCRGLELLRARAPRLHYLRFNSDAEMERYAKILAEME
jgi:transketolase